MTIGGTEAGQIRDHCGWLLAGCGADWCVFATRIAEATAARRCDPVAMLRLLRESSFPVILFDWANAPGGDGRELCRQVRRLCVNSVLVAVTKRVACADRIEAWKSGVDDCIDDEIGLDELVARVHSILSRQRAAPLSDQGIDVKTRQLAVRYRLSRREQEALVLLVRGVHQKEIATHLGCGYATVRTHLRRLCHKLACSSTREVILRFFVVEAQTAQEEAS
jgi:DNA-binding NarL/FixJ family response regulator